MTSKMRSKAFSTGFVNGFTAPYRFVTLPRICLSHPSGETLSLAWKDVGRDLNDAIEIEVRNIVRMKRDSTRRPKQRDKLSD